MKRTLVELLEEFAPVEQDTMTMSEYYESEIRDLLDLIDTLKSDLSDYYNYEMHVRSVIEQQKPIMDHYKKLYFGSEIGSKDYYTYLGIWSGMLAVINAIESNRRN